MKPKATLFEWRTNATTAEKDMGDVDTADELLEDAGQLIDRLNELVAQFSMSSEALLSQMSHLREQLQLVNLTPSTNLSLTTSSPLRNSLISSSSHGSTAL